LIKSFQIFRNNEKVKEIWRLLLQCGKIDEKILDVLNTSIKNEISTTLLKMHDIPEMKELINMREYIIKLLTPIVALFGFKIFKVNLQAQTH